jgi:hypothetical protein
MEENPDDSIGRFPGNSRILSDWVGSNAPKSYGGYSGYYNGYHFENEWYRHANNKACQTLWVAGHVSKIKFTGFTVGIDYRYYTGEAIQRPIQE